MSDAAWMAEAIALATLGEGQTPPNPLVGCAVVQGGRCVGVGFHRAAGAPHAEAIALASAGASARGATLYVNLEPCAHHGRTPPCVDAIVRAGVARVVAACRDPNPLVDGRGFAALRAAGVGVQEGVLEEEARRLNAPFLSIHERARPFVTLKAALSHDGQIAAARGSSTWITGVGARRFAHRLRFRHDAVLVGAGTIRRDDPQLTVRLDGVAAHRLRAVLAPGADLDPGARVFAREAGPAARVYVSSRADGTARLALAPVAEVVPVGEAGAGLRLDEVLDDLLAQGVQSLLVEGGGRTLSAFLEAGLADEVILCMAPSLLGSVGATPLLRGPAAADPASAWRLEDVRRIPIGSDLVVVARPVKA